MTKKKSTNNPHPKKRFERKAVVSLRLDIESLALGGAKATLSGGISTIGKEPMLETVTVIRDGSANGVWLQLKLGIAAVISAFEKEAGLGSPDEHQARAARSPAKTPKLPDLPKLPRGFAHPRQSLTEPGTKKAKKPLAVSKQWVKRRRPNFSLAPFVRSRYPGIEELAFPRIGGKVWGWMVDHPPIQRGPLRGMVGQDGDAPTEELAKATAASYADKIYKKICKMKENS